MCLGCEHVKRIHWVIYTKRKFLFSVNKLPWKGRKPTKDSSLHALTKRVQCRALIPNSRPRWGPSSGPLVLGFSHLELSLWWPQSVISFMDCWRMHRLHFLTIKKRFTYTETFWKSQHGVASQAWSEMPGRLNSLSRDVDREDTNSSLHVTSHGCWEDMRLARTRKAWLSWWPPGAVQASASLHGCLPHFHSWLVLEVWRGE